jgi:hypothetical protein
VHILQRHDRGRVRPREGVVQDAAASDRRELVPVAYQRDPRLGLVGNRQERPGGVLVEHPRFGTPRARSSLVIAETACA